jgi:hypothetical protein
MLAAINYNRLCYISSDINEHMPTLYKYAMQCKHITEMGVREVVSTWAFLNARPDTLISYDLYTSSNITSVYTAALEVNTNFIFIQNDVLQVDIDETDLLFIDTLHQYKQLKQELKKHAPKVRKYIIMHDTTKFASIDERTGEAGGLWPAVEEFLTHNDDWQLIERYTNNNGLTIIGRT